MMSDLRKFWSQRQESNPQPTDYEAVNIMALNWESFIHPCAL